MLGKKCLFSLFFLLPLHGYAEIVIRADNIYLSDLFELPQNMKDVRVASAPLPGKRQTFSATFLEGLAQRHRINCRDLRDVTIVRAGHKIPPENLEKLFFEKFPRALRDSVGIRRLVLQNSAIIVPEGFTEIELKHFSQEGRQFRGLFLASNGTGETYSFEVWAEIPRHMLIRRNTLVVLRARTNNLVATVQGRALDAGGWGDLIRVVNTQSGKTVQGIVCDEKFVDVALAQS